MCRRVLTIDDEPETTRAIKRLLEAHGFRVWEENDATRALSTARAFRPHAIILDFLMPDADGGDVAWQLVSDPAFEGVKLIVCSGTDPLEIKRGLPPIQIAILEKPVNSETLLALLRLR